MEGWGDQQCVFWILWLFWVCWCMVMVLGMIMGFLNREFVEVGRWKNWMNGCVMEIFGNSFVLSMFYMFSFMGELNKMRMV